MDGIWNWERVEETGSTNEDLKKRREAPHGTALIARRQRGGKGRLGRQFSSPEGGLYLSLLLRPKTKPEDLLHLTAMAAVAVRRGILDCCGVEAGIKWPNDLVYGNRKLCGILTELVTEEGLPARVIIGVGLNCNTVPEEVRDMATSLREITGNQMDIDGLAAAILQALSEMDRELLSGKSRYLREYESACVSIGKQVQLIKGEERISAYTLGIDENGGLLLRYADGREGVVNTGEVSVRGMYGYL
ncbi:MAG: biotin--[Oscillospiraceae bacterium]|nr:biotin--[acetyl-CoA-carboxylase] ligase [Oscillospiraceae bacterium]